MKKFKTINAEADKAALLKALYSEAGIFSAAKAYSDLVWQYRRKKTFLLTARMNSKQRLQNLERIKHIIELSVKHDISPELFLKAQFDQLATYSPRTFPALSVICSPRAEERLQNFLRRMERTYVSSAEREERLSKTVSTERPLVQSIQRFVQRLQRVVDITGHLDEDAALCELEALVRGGEIKTIYVAVAPLVLTYKNEYLQNIKAIETKRLKKAELEKAAFVRERLVATVTSPKVRRYV